MTSKPIFFGRKAELKQFDEVLRSPEGQAAMWDPASQRKECERWDHQGGARPNGRDIV